MKRSALKPITYLNHIKEVKHKSSTLTKEQKSELDLTLAEHKSGKLKYYTVDQAKEIIKSK